MTVAELRSILAESARNAGISSADTSNYDADTKDRAIYHTLNHFIRKTRCTRQVNDIDLTQDDDDISFASVTGFEDDRIIDLRVESSPWATAVLTAGAVSSIIVNYSPIFSTAPTVTFSGGEGSGATATAVLTLGRVTSFTITAGGSDYTSAPTVYLNGSSHNYTNIEVRDGIGVTEFSEIAAARADLGTLSGTPTKLAMVSATGGKLYRTPKADGVAKLVWSPPLITSNAGTPATWTMGASGASAYTINVPEDLAATAVRTGSVCWLQQGQLEHLPLTNPLYAQYLAHIADSGGRATPVVKSFVRTVRRR